MRIRGTGVRLAMLAAGLAGLAPVALTGSATAATAAASSTAAWHVATSTKTAFLTSLTAPSVTNIWALGTGSVPGNPSEGVPFGLHWNGSSWTKASFPQAISKTGIGCAGATAPHDIWAFAGTSSAGGDAAAAGALRLVNGRWKLVKAFPAGIVTSCLVLSPTDVWVFGDAHVAPGVGLWHLNGTTWTNITSLPYALANASAISAGDVWAEGDDSFGFPVVSRWNGRSWVRNTALTAALPKPSSSRELFIDGITAISDSNVWLRVLVTTFSGGNRSDGGILLGQRHDLVDIGRRVVIGVDGLWDVGPGRRAVGAQQAGCGVDGIDGVVGTGWLCSTRRSGHVVFGEGRRFELHGPLGPGNVVAAVHAR